MGAVVNAPDAVRAIHDAHFATEPPDWTAYMARLQYLSEKYVGSTMRREQANDDAAFDKVAKRIG